MGAREKAEGVGGDEGDKQGVEGVKDEGERVGRERDEGKGGQGEGVNRGVEQRHLEGMQMTGRGSQGEVVRRRKVPEEEGVAGEG